MFQGYILEQSSAFWAVLAMDQLGVAYEMGDRPWPAMSVLHACLHKLQFAFQLYAYVWPWLCCNRLEFFWC